MYEEREREREQGRNDSAGVSRTVRTIVLRRSRYFARGINAYWESGLEHFLWEYWLFPSCHNYRIRRVTRLWRWDDGWKATKIIHSTDVDSTQRHSENWVKHNPKYKPCKKQTNYKTNDGEMTEICWKKYMFSRLIFPLIDNGRPQDLLGELC